jgi:hypothetical protein
LLPIQIPRQARRRMQCQRWSRPSRPGRLPSDVRAPDAQRAFEGRLTLKQDEHIGPDPRLPPDSANYLDETVRVIYRKKLTLEDGTEVDLNEPNPLSEPVDWAARSPRPAPAYPAR